MPLPPKSELNQSQAEQQKLPPMKLPSTGRYFLIDQLVRWAIWLLYQQSCLSGFFMILLQIVAGVILILLAQVREARIRLKLKQNGKNLIIDTTSFHSILIFVMAFVGCYATSPFMPTSWLIRLPLYIILVAVLFIYYFLIGDSPVVHKTKKDTKKCSLDFDNPEFNKTRKTFVANKSPSLIDVEAIAYLSENVVQC